MIAGLFLLDQWSKYAILNTLQSTPYKTIEVTSFFNLAFVWNRGISFGILNDLNLKWILIVFTFSIIIILIFLWIKSVMVAERLGLTLILAGAIGNLSDRIIYGAVLDFLDFHIYGWHFWTFNLADSFISIGAVFLLYEHFICTSKTG